MKVLLLYKSGRPGAGDYFARMMPVGLGWINATLRAAGFDSRLANLSLVGWPEARALLARERPRLVGITLYTFNRHAGLRLAALAKRASPGCTVVVGGPHATHLGASILAHYPDVDVVGLGEGEITMRETARALRDGAPLHSVRGLMLRGSGGAPLNTGARETVADLDSLPLPAPHYRGFRLDVEAEASFVITSRGCPARCTFCNTPDFWGTRMRFRGPESMLEEFRFLKDELGVLHVSVRDDTFTVHKRRVIEFCRLLIASRLGVTWSCQSRVNAIDEERLAWMRRAGCDHVQYGVESGSPRVLGELAKDITVEEIRAAAAATRAVGLTLSIYLISGVPGEMEEDFQATERLVSAIRPHDGLVAPLAVYPGTHLHDRMKAEGRLDDDFWIGAKREALYLMPGEAGRRSFRRLTRLCARVGREAGYSREELEEHKRLLPDSFATWIASGDALLRDGDVGGALGEYERAADLAPGSPWPPAREGTLLLASGDPRGAALYFRRAAGCAPRSRWLGRLLERAERAAGGTRARRAASAPSGGPERRRA